MSSYLFSLLTVTTHALHSDQTIISTQSYSSLLTTCFTSSLEPATYITQNSSSELLIPLSATIIWTCWFATHCNHLPSLFTVSLWAQNRPFQKIISATLVCFCLSDWSHGSRVDRSPDIFAHRFYVLVLFCFSYSYVRQTNLASSLVNFLAHYKIVLTD